MMGLPAGLGVGTVAASVTVPGAPTIGTALYPSAGGYEVNWTAPASNGGSAITGYRVISTPAGANKVVAPGTRTTLLASDGVTYGTAYTFKVNAINAIGEGAQSAASNSRTAYGPDTVPGDGTFGSSFGWTAGANWTISGGVATAGIGSGVPGDRLECAATDNTSGKVWRVEFDIVSITGGSVTPIISTSADLSGTALGTGTTQTTTGSKVVTITAAAGTPGGVRFVRVGGTGNAVIDNVVVRRAS